MRRALVATLLLSPIFVSAQAIQPAPAMLNAAVKSADATTAKTVRVSTGVIAPKLVHTTSIPTDRLSFWERTGQDRKFVVSMVVDATGVPSDLKITESPDAQENRSVLDAVSQYRFTPGTISNQPTSVPVSLEVVLKNQSGY